MTRMKTEKFKTRLGNYDRIKSHNPLILNFSDITTLHQHPNQLLFSHTKMLAKLQPLISTSQLLHQFAHYFLILLPTPSASPLLDFFCPYDSKRILPTYYLLILQTSAVLTSKLFFLPNTVLK